MAELRFRKQSKTNWTPVAYDTNETVAVMNVSVGDLIGPNALRVRTAFNGTGGRTVSIGDDGDVDMFLTTSNGDLSTAAMVQGTGGAASTYLAMGYYLYTVANTIDFVFVAATGGSPTAGSADWMVYIAKFLA